MATAKKTKTATAKKTTKKKAVAKKTTTRKAATKAGTTRKTAKKTTSQKKGEGRVLICANGKQCFWTTDGQVLRDLTELRDALDAMEDKVFNHHVTKEKNDFADWVEQVLVDSACAAELRKSQKSNTARTVVVRHLKQYSL